MTRVFETDIRRKSRAGAGKADGFTVLAFANAVFPADPP
jgi:hypothetical protein